MSALFETMGYAALLSTVIERGERVPSRYGDTREQLGAQLIFRAGWIPPRRKIALGIGWAEGLQLISGEFDIEAIRRVAPNSRLELFTAEMAYGPRVKNRVPVMLRALRENQNTRQAVMFVAKPEDGPTSSQPCTTSIQFLIRRGSLCACVSMRSWDLVKGLPYDCIQFGLLVHAMARNLGAAPGAVCVTAGSAHVYDEDRDFAVVNFRSEKTFRLDPDLAPIDWAFFKRWAKEESDRLAPSVVPTGIIVEEKVG